MEVAAVDPVLANLGPILTLVGVIAAAWFTYRGSNRKLKADTGLQLLNERQEEVAELRKELSEARRRERLQGDYIGELRRHISDGNPPPAPSWPPGLTA